jgi:hypothetical protein
LLELRGDAKQRVLARVGRDEVDPDRQAVGSPMERQGDRRLPGGVARGRERNPFEVPLPALPRIAARPPEVAEALPPLEPPAECLGFQELQVETRRRRD